MVEASGQTHCFNHRPVGFKMPSSVLTIKYSPALYTYSNNASTLYKRNPTSKAFFNIMTSISRVDGTALILQLLKTRF